MNCQLPKSEERLETPKLPESGKIETGKQPNTDEKPKTEEQPKIRQLATDEFLELKTAWNW